MAERTTNTLFGIVSITTTKTTERNWIGQVNSETASVTIKIEAEVPQQFLDAAEAISTATPKIVAGAHAAGSTLKTHALSALPTLRGKKT